jgi:hypothetical protein
MILSHSNLKHFIREDISIKINKLIRLKNIPIEARHGLMSNILIHTPQNMRRKLKIQPDINFHQEVILKNQKKMPTMEPPTIHNTFTAPMHGPVTNEQ